MNNRLWFQPVLTEYGPERDRFFRRLPAAVTRLASEPGLQYPGRTTQHGAQMAHLRFQILRAGDRLRHTLAEQIAEA